MQYSRFSVFLVLTGLSNFSRRALKKLDVYAKYILKTFKSFTFSLQKCLFHEGISDALLKELQIHLVDENSIKCGVLVYKCALAAYVVISYITENKTYDLYLIPSDLISLSPL